jgi:hypothetical protein
MLGCTRVQVGYQITTVQYSVDKTRSRNGRGGALIAWQTEPGRVFRQLKSGGVVFSNDEEMKIH